MAHLIGKLAPNFTATAVYHQEFKDISLTDFKGKFLVLFFYPMDFTRVCASEIVMLSEHMTQFTERDCEVLGVSCDSHFAHLAWIGKLLEENNLVGAAVPLLADKSGQIARKYDVYNKDQGVSSRAFFIIDKDQVIRDMSINDRPVGRSMDEILQLIDILRLEKIDDAASQVKRGLKRILPACDLPNHPAKSSKIDNMEATVIIH